MRRLRELTLRFGGLLNKQRKDRELDEEIESHLQMHVEDNLRLGMTPEEARREARIKLGLKGKAAWTISPGWNMPPLFPELGILAAWQNIPIAINFRLFSQEVECAARFGEAGDEHAVGFILVQDQHSHTAIRRQRFPQRQSESAIVANAHFKCFHATQVISECFTCQESP
jgi:hypothetical protein